MWQAISGYIASCSKLVERHCSIDKSCPRCGAYEETINHIFFECPPALQTWALSSIPTIPGEFPSNSIYKNFDHLLWRAKEMGATEEHIESFPWIFWFIWKARNDKTFNGEDISALDTVQWATSESECWKMAQVVSSTVDSISSPDLSSGPEDDSLWPQCKTDASWERNDKVAGLGFVLTNEEGSSLYGSMACRNAQSSLHAELEAINWAMKNASDIGYTSIHIQTDCSQVLTMIKEEEEWPAFTAEIEEFGFLKACFTSFRISLISRNLNVRTDSLAKRARSRGSVFSEVHSLPPNGLPLEAHPFVTTS